MSFVNNNKPDSNPTTRANVAKNLRGTNSIREIYGDVKKSRRCQGTKFNFDLKKGAISVYRCFSRDSRIVRSIKRTLLVNADDTEIPEEMRLELKAADELYRDKLIDEKHWNQLRNEIDGAYKQKILKLQEIKSYSGDILHLCPGCRSTYEKKNPERELHFIDLKLA